MYYEEKVVNGVLCYRNNPRGEFVQFTLEQLTKKYLEATKCD